MAHTSKRSSPGGSPILAFATTSEEKSPTNTDEEDKQIAEWWIIIAKCQVELDTLQESCPENFAHMSLLVQAETARWKRQSLKAIRLYGRAVDEAKKYEFIYHEALSAELFAEFFLTRSDHNHAGYWLRRSIHSYRLWGARRKVSMLKLRHARLLDLRDMLLSARPLTGVVGLPTVSPTSHPVYASSAGHMNVANASTASSGGGGIRGATTSMAVGVSMISGVASSHQVSALASGSGTSGSGSSGHSGSGSGHSTGASPHGASSSSTSTSSTSGEHSSGAAAAALVQMVASSPLDGPVSSSNSVIIDSNQMSPYITGSSLLNSTPGTEFSSPASLGISSPHTIMSPLGSPESHTTSLSRATPRVRSRAIQAAAAAAAAASGLPTSNSNLSASIGMSTNNINTGGINAAKRILERGRLPTGIPNAGIGGGVAASSAAGGGGIILKKRGVNAQIDAQSMLDASLAISQEMQLERALMSLLNILLSCSGAESGTLISKRNGKWVVEAKATPKGCEVFPTLSDDDNTADLLATTVSAPATASPLLSSTSVTPNQGVAVAPAASPPRAIGSLVAVPSGHGKLFASRTDSPNQLSVLVQKRNHRARTAPHDRSTSSLTTMSTIASTSSTMLPPSAVTVMAAAAASSTPPPPPSAPTGLSSFMQSLVSPTASASRGSNGSAMISPNGSTVRAADGSYVYRPSGPSASPPMSIPRHSRKPSSTSVAPLASNASTETAIATSTAASAATSHRFSAALSTSPPPNAMDEPPKEKIQDASPAYLYRLAALAGARSANVSPSTTVSMTASAIMIPSTSSSTSPTSSSNIVPSHSTSTSPSSSSGTSASFQPQPSVSSSFGSGGASVTTSSTYAGGFSYHPADTPIVPGESSLSAAPVPTYILSPEAPSVKEWSATSYPQPSSSLVSTPAIATTSVPSVTFDVSESSSEDISTSAVIAAAATTTLSTTSTSGSTTSAGSIGIEEEDDDEHDIIDGSPERRSHRNEHARATLAALSSASVPMILPSSPMPVGPQLVSRRPRASSDDALSSSTTSLSSVSSSSLVSDNMTNLPSSEVGTAAVISTSATSTPSVIQSSRSRTAFTAPPTPEPPLPSPPSTFYTNTTNSSGGNAGNIFVDDDVKATSIPARVPPLPSNIDVSLQSLWMQLPLTLFNFVLHTGKSPILSDASTDRQFSSDPYVQHFKPKSVMVVPFHLRNEMVSVLYLENNLAKGAFTSDRLDMVKLLSSQAAISLENARLYTQLERHNRTLGEKVEHRTRQLRDAQDVAERANLAKSLFLSTMSHEIRTPLNGVIGTTQLLLEQPHTLDVDQLEMVETIRDSGQTLLSLINDVLDLTKIESGKFELDLQPFDLRHCIESSMDVVAVKALSQGLDLAYFAPPLVPVMAVADVTRVRQILTNLLSNAVKFTAKGEVVITVEATALEVRSTDDPLASHTPSPDGKRSRSPVLSQFAVATTSAVQSLADDLSGNSSPSRGSPPPRLRPPLQPHELHFAVRDTGIGIPMERAHRLFQIFSQVNTDTSKHYGGTGLGLAISRHFAEMMGGQVWVESLEGKGSTFHFTIRVPCGFDNPPDSLSTNHPSLTGKSVWLVDPNAVVRQQITDALTHWGMRVTAYSNSEDFMAALGRTVSSRATVSSRSTPSTTSGISIYDSPLSSPASGTEIGESGGGVGSPAGTPPGSPLLTRPDLAIVPLHLTAGTRVSRSPAQSPSSIARGINNSGPPSTTNTISGIGNTSGFNSGTSSGGLLRAPSSASVPDGMKLVRRIRAHHSKRKLPIVLMCALSERKQEAKSFVNAFGSKPVKPGQLLKAVLAAMKSDHIMVVPPSNTNDSMDVDDPLSTSPGSGNTDPTGDYRPHSPMALGRVLAPLPPQHRVLTAGPLDGNLSPPGSRSPSWNQTSSHSPGRLFRVASSNSIASSTPALSTTTITVSPTTSGAATNPSTSGSNATSGGNTSGAVALSGPVAAVLRGSPRPSPGSIHRRLRAKAPSGLSTQSSGPAKKVRPLNILVAEDNVVNQKVMPIPPIVHSRSCVLLCSYISLLC
jgi:signal transduction histidine kinase